ncbi:hypothetical protein EII14_06490 [Alloprevotella sp. OH1205_COT-284]|uniref:hypothetical protein n=1 Tax=Alloprevotella sp. OH1205_COT-284 TaxID=2491043 RepID=UPI000F5F401D|nr:hypothetical protein [Alloprevotella sp. OH1205_COT-284]RRD79298.1 hypothetical protein EII14_06490 [Alloprevotella sp. OH1205_COT-284]
MAILDDELMNDAQFDAEVITYVRNSLPQELKDKFDDDLLYYFHDLLEEYLAESDTLEAEPDEDGFVNVDVEKIAAYLKKQAKKEKVGDFTEEELFFIVNAELSFGDDFEE